MGKIVFVGEREKGYFIEDVAQKISLEYAYVESHGHIKYQSNSILAVPDVKYMVFDIEQYIDGADVIAKEIEAIQKCNNAEAIIYASGYLSTSTVIVELCKLGIKGYIFATNLSDMKDQLMKCINGYYEVNGIEELKMINLQDAEEEIKETYNFKMIGVAGSERRIGTTTQAIHIVKYLLYKGYKACYVHMNSTGFITETKEWYVNECDDEIGKLTIEGVDHFYKVEKISDIKRLGYDYYVYDYGAYFDPNFNKVSFLEKDVKIFVLGYKAQEMAYTYKLVSNVFYDDVKYIFSFGRHLEQSEIDGLMEEKAKDTIVPLDCDDMYIFTEPELYEKIIPVDDIKEEPVLKKKKRRFFGRRKKL